MNVEIADRLARKRRERGLSQEELAEKLGVSRQAVSKWERSESSPDTDNLIALAQLYGVSLDDLLYVDEGIADDVFFEARDKASSPSGADGATADAAPADAASDGASAPADDGAEKDYVHLSFKDGIHVHDSKKGDDVHVGWRGVHVEDGAKGDKIHVGWDGVHIHEGATDSSSRASEGFSATDDEGNQIHITDEGVNINGKHYDHWSDAHADWNHEDRHHGKALYMFPFPLVVILAYIVVGLVYDAWGPGLFLAFLIPAYYIIVAGIYDRSLAKTIGGLYPIGATAWFLWMAFICNMAHPAWVIFLTIPIVEFLVMAPSKWWKRRKKSKRDDAVIDADARPVGESDDVL